jgi:hypothetical protein
VRRGASQRRERWLLCVLVMSLLAASGCGSAGAGAGGGVGSSQPLAIRAPVGQPLAQPELIAHADAICRRRNTAIDAVKLSGSSPEDIARFASQSTALEQAALLELGRLRPAAPMAAAWRQLLEYSEMLLQDVVKLGEYGRRHETRLIPALSRSAGRTKRQLLAAATRDGFTYCSRVR